jgi:hypothetical protein
MDGRRRAAAFYAMVVRTQIAVACSATREPVKVQKEQGEAR